MKLENTLENKARFFAQYLNQQVFYQDRIGNIVSFYLSCGNLTKQVWIVSLEDENFEKNELSCEANINECQLILTPLSHISDEDAIEVSKIFGLGHLSGAIKELILSIFRTSINDNGTTSSTNGIKNWIQVFDYLRSKGYALPYMDLSVEDLVEYGWVKLKEN